MTISDPILAAIVGACAALAGAAVNGVIAYWNSERQRRFAAQQGWAEKLLQHRVAAISEVMLAVEQARYAAFDMAWDYLQHPTDSLTRNELRERYSKAITAMNIVIHSQRVFLPPDTFDALQAAHIKHGGLSPDLAREPYWTELHKSWADFADKFSSSAAEHLRFRITDEPISSNTMGTLRMIIERLANRRRA